MSKIKKHKKGNQGLGRKFKKKSQTLVIIVITAAAIGLVGGTLLSSFLSNNSKSSDSRGRSGRIATAEAAEIVSKFNCACGTCNLTLANCDCDDARGAQEMKDFINYNLEQGKLPAQVVQLVKERYGHLR